MLYLPILKWLLYLTVCSLLKKLKQQSREGLDERRPALIQALEDIGDFYLELKWDFQSWGTTFLIMTSFNI